MKNLLFTGISALVLFTSCSEKFDIGASYKNIIVINGILSINDTAHYIRIQKAFLDQTKSALDMAQVSDSNYFNNLDVKVKELYNGNIVNIISLTKVDLNNEGYPKSSGTFFSGPNYAYKFTNILKPSNRYRVVVNNLQTGEIDSAETNVIDTLSTKFRVYLFEQAVNNNTIGFVNKSPTASFEIDGQADSNAMMFEGVLRVHWVDLNTATNVQTDQHADWLFSSVVVPGTGANHVNYLLQTPMQSFYYFMKDNMGPAAPGVKRYLDSCDVMVWAGNKDLYYYNQLAKLQGTGIAGDDMQPLYTNIKGANVLGLLASRAVRIGRNFGFDYATINTLDTMVLLSALNIQKEPADH